MKKLISLFLVLLLCIGTAMAESSIGPVDGNYAEQHTDTQDFFIDVLIEIDQPDDTVLRLPLRFKAFTAFYQYEVYRDIASDYYCGFGYDPESSVYLKETSLQDSPDPNLIRFLLDCIDLQFTQVRRPDNWHFNGYGADYYTMEISGGEFEITYNSRLFFSCYNGQLIDATSTTERRTYSYHSPE